MGTIKDRTNEVFGDLTVIGFGRVDNITSKNGFSYKRNYYLCQCSCGKTLEVVSNSLTSGNTKSCGCLRRKLLIDKSEDLKGMSFNKLTAVSKIEGVGSFWSCICDCGNETTVKAQNLKNGTTKSCGCLNRERRSQTFTEYNKAYRLSKGLSPDVPMEDERKSQRAEFKILRSDIFERDKYTCAWCSSTGAKLNVHHIETWAFAPELRFEKTNLVTLCVSCHKTVHKGNFNEMPDEVSTILLSGYTKVIYDYMSEEITHALLRS